MEYQLMFGSRLIDFTLHYQERKSLRIIVNPEGTVEVLAPIAAREVDLIKKVRQKAPWILKQIDYFNSYKPTTPPRRFINGETHLYLGRQYRLKIVPDEKNIVKAYRGQLWMYTVNNQPAALKEQLNKWYKERAKEVFNELLQESLPKFKQYRIAMPILTMRFMSKRWGSCTPKGKIILNTELIKAPKGSIEYVIIHELCHLVHHNHTRAFQNLQNKMMPDWEKWKDRLEYSLA
ncbi:M48 family metallopeptidase [Chitinophaga agri]|uniref:M48 family metallopeptidase n=1 Tax=Chitinophaga agri TaxID=2703787 RepID=A0A6B9ZJ07_9BACT|nr:SprT family zinc-dependent metalloprotease [Chitinophaga agri]QHS61065.1 M48 family metallopeptidase [Chitinophaga agri]